ncbi:MAG: hypothetical protein VCA36_08615 [Opitutales bacterium]
MTSFSFLDAEQGIYRATCQEPSKSMVAFIFPMVAVAESAPSTLALIVLA